MGRCGLCDGAYYIYVYVCALAVTFSHSRSGVLRPDLSWVTPHKGLKSTWVHSTYLLAFFVGVTAHFNAEVRLSASVSGALLGVRAVFDAHKL